MPKILFVIFLFLGGSSSLVLGAGIIDSVDFIGPRDYRLPPPATADELFANQYAEYFEKEVEISKMLQKEDFLAQWRYTGNSEFTKARSIGPKQSTEGWLLLEILHAQQFENLDHMADMQHLLAWEYFRLGQMEQAFQYFEQALLTKTELNKTQDIMVIHHNLAAMYEFTNDLVCAQNSYEKIHQHAIKRQDRLQQAHSLLKLAMIKARKGHFHEAEEDIIRKIVPLYRTIRTAQGDIGRILAYYVLADVYTLQDRYPEAQWFLLQSRELAREKNHSEWLPNIIFGLAETKNSSGNRMVAIDEYKEADQLAKQSNLLVMQLAIQEALGNIYHEFGNHKEALEALNRFDTLKNQLLLQEVLF